MNINTKNQKWKKIYDIIIKITKRMIYNKKKDEFTCPICGSHDIAIKTGMFLDLYICRKCGFESRDLKFEK